MIDKNDVEERFFVSFSQWYAKVFSLKDFYEWRSFWSWRIFVSEKKLKKKKIYLISNKYFQRINLIILF